MIKMGRTRSDEYTDKVVWFVNRSATKCHKFTNTTNFVDRNLKLNITKLKDQLADIPPSVLYSARKRYDGYFIHGISRGIIKMANLDYIFNLSKRISTFGDVCGGPGGFVEFMLFSNETAIGYGLTLNNTIDKYYINSPRFLPIYGPKNDGDILKAEVRDVFPRGLDLVIADGGLDVNGNENEQEILHLCLYVAQIKLGLMCTRVGGTFVMKFFDTHTHNSVCLLYILAKSFNRLCIYKPAASRAANSERYVVCKVRNCDVEADLRILERGEFTHEKITEAFYNYISERNNCIANIQLCGLRRLMAFSNNSRLVSRPVFRRQWRLDEFLFTKYRIRDDDECHRRQHRGHYRNRDFYKNSHDKFTNKRHRL